MDQYLQLVRDGADGFQLDKTGGVNQLDFNTQLPVSPDKSLPQGVLDTFKELLPAARKINPGFSLAGEVWFDRSLPYVDVSYMRMGSIDIGSTVLRYTFPEWTSTIFGETPADYHQMNNGMRYGFVWDLSPRYYTASVDELLTRPLARYVSELIRIRKQYGDLLFFGRFNDTMGATVTRDPDIRYSVFDPLQPASRGRACVIVNFGSVPESAEVHLDGLDGEVTIATPFEPDRRAILPVKVTIPPNTVEVIVKR